MLALRAVPVGAGVHKAWWGTVYSFKWLKGGGGQCRQKMEPWAGNMAQWLRALPVLPEDLGFASQHPTWPLTAVYKSRTKGPNNLSWPPGAQTYMQANCPAHKVNN